MIAPRVFVSYAQDSAEHLEAVRDLWILLRSQGVDARLDLPAAERRQDWPIWMLRQVREADFVLVIASPAYRRRAEGDTAADEGGKVQFEAALIRDELYRDREAGMGRFLPVVLPGGSADDIPAFLDPTAATVYRVDEIGVVGMERLLRVLTGQPLEVEPPLGPGPMLPPRAVDRGAAAWTPLTHELALEVELEGGRLRCRALLAGTVLVERTAVMPYGLEGVWAVLAASPVVAEERLVAAGERLRGALLDEAAVRHVTDLLDRSPLGTVIEIVVQADGPALGLPYELLRLPDGRLLATVPGVRLCRRVAGVDRPATAPLPGPLKLLIAVAAPEETRTPNPPLDTEAEMQAILDAVGGVGGRGDAQVTILEFGGLAEMAEALRADQYHVLHLSAHGSANGAELEDEDGNPVWVDATAFIDQLRAAGRPLPLLVLSSCAGGAGGSDALAATLVRYGADRVVAMQTAVTDTYATQLARDFYEGLATDARMSVAEALAQARRQTEQDRIAAQQAGGKVQRPEYGVATLLAGGGDPPLRDPTVDLQPLARPSRAPSGTRVRELRIGDLVGRRSQLRTALAVLRGSPVALDRFGDIAGVLLCGVGGIGKTALARRILSRLAEDGWLTAVHEGRWNPPALISAVATALTNDARLADARAVLTDPQIDDISKLAMVHELLARERLLVLFDDFEQNLTTGGGGFDDPGFAEVMDGLYQAASVGQLLITSRYPLPDSQAMLERIDLPPLSASELRRLLLRLPALRKLEPDDRQMLVDTIGGNPRLIEFIDALLRQGRANRRETSRRLRRLAAHHGITIPGQRSLTQAVEEAVLLSSRDIFLDELLGALAAEDRELLLQAAVSTLPMTIEDLAFARWGADPTAEQQASVASGAERLVDLTLMSSAGDGEIVVHAWIANALASHQQKELLEQRHKRAADMRLARLTAGRGGFADLVEIARHRAEARQYAELIEFARNGCDLIGRQLGELSVAAFLGQVIPLVPTDLDGFLPLADRELRALLNTGSVAAALDHAQRIAAAARQRADADPTNAAAQRDLGVIYERLGDLMVRVGNLGEAERFHRDSLTIRDRLVQADPTNTAVQRELSVSYNKLGDLMVRVGNLGEAERFHRTGLTIVQRLADADPTNTAVQRDLSVSYNKLGDLMVRVGNLGEAERFHRTGLTIVQRLTDADPTNTAVQRELSVSYNKLGDLMMAAGNLGEAERFHRDSLTIRDRLVQADPTNAAVQRDLGVSYERLGDLMMEVGNLGEAERFHRTGLTIVQRLADTDPTNAAVQRDLSVSYNKLGDLMMEVGNLGEAERFHRDSLTIRDRLAQADPTNTAVQRELSVSYERLGDLMVKVGNLQQAKRFLSNSLDMAKAASEEQSVIDAIRGTLKALEESESPARKPPAPPGPPPLTPVPGAPMVEPGDVTEVDGQVLSFVVEEHRGEPAPCLLGTPFTGVFQAGEAPLGNLLEGDRLVPRTDIPEQGLATQWLVTSTTVELSAIDGDERVQVGEAAAGDQRQWMAAFPLLIPRRGTVAVRLRCTARSVPEGRLDVQIRVDGELYRTLLVRLAVAEPEAAPTTSRHEPAETRQPNLEAPASVAPVSVVDTVVVPAVHTSLRPSAEWQTPAQRLSITFAPPHSFLQSDALDLRSSVPWNPQEAVVQGHIANLRRSVDDFRAEFSDVLDDIEPADLADRLAAYVPRGWPTAPRAAEDSRHVAWSTMAASEALRRVALYGRDLYDELLPEGSAHREAVEGLVPGSRLDVDWFNDGSTFWVPHVPWSLLYSGDPQDAVDAQRFLGLRLRIANTTHAFLSRSRALGPAGATTRAHLVYWGAGDPTGEVATRHRDDLERWGPVLPLATTEDRKAELMAFLRQPAPPPVSVIYLFCQCRAGDGAQPELRFGSTNSAPDVLSILDLGRDAFDSQPLVFLNACDTAKAEPYFVNELESRFLRRHARAFIGTESKVPIRFAASFATAFFHFLYRRPPGAAPTPAGEAFAQARAFFWDQYANPGGLLYAYVNDFNLYAARDDEVASLRGA